MSAPLVSDVRKQVVFDVRGMDCAECARSVATAVERLPGVSSANVNFGAGTLTIEADSANQVDLSPRVLHAVEVAGYRAVDRSSAKPAESRSSIWRDRRIQLACASVAFWLIGVVAGIAIDSPKMDYGHNFYFAAVIAGSLTFGRAALQSIRSRRIDMNVLMTVAIIGALLLGEWSEAAAAAALFAIGNLAQSLTFERTRNALSSLSNLTPPEARRVVDGREKVVSVDLIQPGELLRVRPGERFPVDAVITEGATTVDESLITGESMPLDRAIGSAVYAGTLNGAGSVLIEATRPASESTISHIVQLVEEARGSRGHSEQTIDRFAAIYTPLVVGMAAIVALVGGWATSEWQDWATRALVLLVIACPCALIISTPVAIVSAVGVAARRGFLIKGGAALEAIASIRVVAFDKTGTLTRGRPEISQVAVLGTTTEAEFLSKIASVEALSEHPLASAIVTYTSARGIAPVEATGFQAIAGRGAFATVDGAEIYIGSPVWFDELGFLTDPAIPQDIERAMSAGQTVLLVGEVNRNGKTLLGTLALADQVRPESAPVVGSLIQLGINPVVMMTGDNLATAHSIASDTGIVKVHAGLLPAQKAALVAELGEQVGPVAMVGDGINDGPALGSATVGFAMGLTGSDLAIETADVAILRNDLFAVPGAIDLSRRTIGIIRQNIGTSLAIKVVALLLTLLGVTTLWMAVAIDLGTSLLVTANALRLTRWQLPGAGHRHVHEGTLQSATGEATGVPALPGTGISTG